MTFVFLGVARRNSKTIAPKWSPGAPTSPFGGSKIAPGASLEGGLGTHLEGLGLILAPRRKDEPKERLLDPLQESKTL